MLTLRKQQVARSKMTKAGSLGIHRRNKAVVGYVALITLLAIVESGVDSLQKVNRRDDHKKLFESCLAGSTKKFETIRIY